MVTDDDFTSISIGVLCSLLLDAANSLLSDTPEVIDLRFPSTLIPTLVKGARALHKAAIQHRAYENYEWGVGIDAASLIADGCGSSRYDVHVGLCNNATEGASAVVALLECVTNSRTHQWLKSLTDELEYVPEHLDAIMALLQSHGFGNTEKTVELSDRLHKTMKECFDLNYLVQAGIMRIVSLDPRPRATYDTNDFRAEK